MDFKKAILNEVNVYSAFNKTRMGSGKLRVSAINFNSDYGREMKKLLTELETSTYLPSDFNIFTIREPKERVVEAPVYRDKIVQHMLNNVLSPFFVPTFIKDSYACIPGRGNLAALKTIQSYFRQAKKCFGDEIYLVRVDIKKFFYTVDLKVLMDIIKCYVDDIWLLNLIKRLLQRKGRLVGLPLGNLLSQLFSNVYLNVLDQWVKGTLRIKWYVRYADDIVIIVKCKKLARVVKNKIKHFIEVELKLNVNEKKTLIEKPCGSFSFLGFRVHPLRFKVLYKTKRRLINKIKRATRKTMGKKELSSLKKSVESSLSFMSLGELGNYKSLLENVLDGTKISFDELDYIHK